MKKFVIVGTQRTGSSALAEAIGSHPRIVCGSEWTQLARFLDKIKIAERSLSEDFSVLTINHQQQIAAALTPSKQVLGFRRLFRSSDKWLCSPRYSPALWVDRLEDHLTWLSSRRDIHVVHIVRCDNLAWLTSKALSRETGMFFGQPYPENLEVSVEINSSLRRLKSKNWVDTRLKSLEETNPYLRIMYEDFRSDNRKHAERVISFLGYNPEELPILHMRAKPQSLKNGKTRILNQELLSSALDKHGLSDGSI